MSPLLRNILAVLIGSVACLMLNGVLLGLMMQLIAPPEGFDANDLATYDLLRTRHMLSPFIAHAVPSFIGGMLAARIAYSHKMTFALVIGGLHMIGGIAAAFMIPAPVWFVVADLTLAYIPMAWLGGKAALRTMRK